MEDGSLELIDGHLRAETTPDQPVPVLVLDVTADEATKILLTHDPLANMADTNAEQLAALLDSCSFENDSVREMLGQLTPVLKSEPPKAKPEMEIPESYQIVVSCADESQQRDLYERLSQEGFACRLLML